MSRDFLRSPLVGLLACLLALVVAMGVGRFSLTPQLPHLIREGQLDLTGAGLLAAANYLGYLVGALDALFAREARQARLRLLVGLWACFGLTLASVWAEGFWPHALLRFGLGVASAWVLIMVTALSQRLAAESGRARLGALVFAGPGIGVMVTGLLAALGNALGQDSVFIWKLFADLALVLILMLLPLLPRPAARSAGHDAPATASENAGLGRLTWAYGLVGLGYIIPATFLSQMAAARFHGQWQADLFWPCFGLASATGVVLISLRRQRPDGTRRWLVGALWLQALGVLACLLPGIGGLALGGSADRPAVPRRHATGDAIRPRTGAAYAAAQRRPTDHRFRPRPVARPAAGGAQHAFRRRPATGAGARRARPGLRRPAVAPAALAQRRSRRRSHCSPLTRVMPARTSAAPATKFRLSGSPSSNTPKVTPNRGVMKEKIARLFAR